MGFTVSSLTVCSIQGSVDVNWPLVIASAAVDLVYNTAVAWGLDASLMWGCPKRYRSDFGVCALDTAHPVGRYTRMRSHCLTVGSKSLAAQEFLCRIHVVSSTNTCHCHCQRPGRYLVQIQSRSLLHYLQMWVSQN